MRAAIGYKKSDSPWRKDEHSKCSPNIHNPTSALFQCAWINENQLLIIYTALNVEVRVIYLRGGSVKNVRSILFYFFPTFSAVYN